MQRRGAKPEEDPTEDPEQVVGAGQQEEEAGVPGLHGGPRRNLLGREQRTQGR